MSVYGTDKKRLFQATAVNAAGLRFRITFLAWNWAGIQEVADAALAKAVAADPLHQKNGPWKAVNIDVTAS